MQVWSLDTHPILSEFRIVSKNIVPIPDTYFHLFLPPQAVTSSKKPEDYFFFANCADPTTLTCFTNHRRKMKLGENEVVAEVGFPENFKFKILLNSPCSANALQFVIYEVENDFYKPAALSPLADLVVRCAKSAQESQHFLSETLGDASVSDYLKTIDKVVFTLEIDSSNRNQVVDDMREWLSQLSSLVFDIPEVKDLPVGTKRVMNTLIFNAVSAKVHFMLVMAFNNAFQEENKKAQYASRFVQANVNIDQEKMEEGVRHLRSILHLKNPMDMINCLVLFFDEIVAALPGVDVAADDILPAICLAMTRDLGFGSHVVSFFNYLTEIWPATGMDERVTYILVTCSIAAQHLATMKENDRAIPVSKSLPAMPEVHQMEEKTEETIELLEDLLNCL